MLQFSVAGLWPALVMAAPFVSLALLALVVKRKLGVCDMCGAKVAANEDRCVDCADHMRCAP